MTKHARVDETGLLLEWGLSDYGGQGVPVPEDFVSPVGTVRWTGSAWVAVPQVDARGFEVALHDIFPGQAFFAFWVAFPLSGLFLDSIRNGTWPLTEALVQTALAQQAITQQNYDDIKAAALAHAIPVTL